ncbi:MULTISPECIES: hypothetical protein [unclassified Bacillus cereus group]|nr:MULTISPECIES: hypothetical protein [unclassified Bacillus cereus group]
MMNFILETMAFAGIIFIILILSVSKTLRDAKKKRRNKNDK